jgi:hypothetical protein
MSFLGELLVAWGILVDYGGSSGAMIPYKMVAKIVMPLIFGAASLIIILGCRRKPDEKNWAYRVAGTLLGF